jgi:predicted RNA-binding protein YlxR (DUF448 family)
LADEEIDNEPETGPLRRCAVTRERLPKEMMIRFVVAPDATVVPDLAERLPGRGIWLSAKGDVLETARVRGAFAKSARRPVKVPANLVADVTIALTGRIRETLGLARRAGLAVAGFAKAREWLAEGKAALVMQASDGSPGERSRLLGANAGRLPAVAPLDGATLGQVFGRDQAVHVAIAPGRLAERLLAETARLAGVTGQEVTKPTGAAGPVLSPGAPAGQDNAGG